MSQNLALHDAHLQLADQDRRFNALAKVAGDNMAKRFHTVYIAPVSALAAAGAAAVCAKFDTKGIVGSALAGAALWGASWFAQENADVRNVLTAGAAGFGDAALAIFTYEQLLARMKAQTAPAPVVAAPAT